MTASEEWEVFDHSCRDLGIVRGSGEARGCFADGDFVGGYSLLMCVGVALAGVVLGSFVVVARR